MADHPPTKCIHCSAEISWMLIDGNELMYADFWGTANCPDPLQDNIPFPHEPINGYNDGFAYQAELDAWLQAREDAFYAQEG